jgi:hypothetical protein
LRKPKQRAGWKTIEGFAMNNNSTPVNYFAIFEGQIPKGFGAALWIIVCSLLGFLFGVAVLVYGLLSDGSSAVTPGILIIVASGGVFGVTLFLAPALSRKANKNQDQPLYGFLASGNTLRIGSWRVKTGRHEMGGDGEKLKPVTDLKNVSESHSIQLSRDRIELLISVDVVPDNSIVNFNDRIRIKNLVLLEGDDRIWSADLSGGSTYRMAVAEGRCHYLPLYTSAKTSGVMEALRVLGEGLQASGSQLATTIRFNRQHISLLASGLLLGAFGVATATLGNVQAEKELSKMTKQGTLRDKKTGMTFPDMVGKYGWKVDIADRN